MDDLTTVMYIKKAYYFGHNVLCEVYELMPRYDEGIYSIWLSTTSTIIYNILCPVEGCDQSLFVGEWPNPYEGRVCMGRINNNWDRKTIRHQFHGCYNKYERPILKRKIESD